MFDPATRKENANPAPQAKEPQPSDDGSKRAPAVASAARALQNGRPILLFDGDDREGETDLFFPAHQTTPKALQRLRDAGGLVFVAIGPELRETLGLPLLEDLHREARDRWPVLGELGPDQLPYDSRSSFSLTVNHEDTFTGITDRDRAKTIRGLGQLASLIGCLEGDELRTRFTDEFRTPGHVHLCAAAEGLLEARQGHTELAVALAQIAGIPPALAGAEVLDGETAMAAGRARQRAEALGIPFVDGTDVTQAWERSEPERGSAGLEGAL